MRIKPLVLSIIFLAYFGYAPAQQMDTFYVVSQYKTTRADWAGDFFINGLLPMQVYLPNNQQVTLFAKEKGQKPFPSNPPISPNRQLHCLRIVKQRNSLFTVRIVVADSIGTRRKPCVTVDTTIHINDVPFNQNIVTVFYFSTDILGLQQKLIVSKLPKHMAYIPSKSKKKRKRYLNRYLKGIQYEYNAVTDKLTQLY